MESYSVLWNIRYNRLIDGSNDVRLTHLFYCAMQQRDNDERRRACVPLHVCGT